MTKPFPLEIYTGDSFAWGVVIERKVDGYVVPATATFAAQIREWRGAPQPLIEPDIETRIHDDMIVVQLRLTPGQTATLRPYTWVEWDLQMTLPDIAGKPNVITTHSGRVRIRTDVTR